MPLNKYSWKFKINKETTPHLPIPAHPACAKPNQTKLNPNRTAVELPCRGSFTCSVVHNF